MKKLLHGFGYILEYCGLVIVIILLWSLLAKTGRLNPVIMPPPGKIVQTAWKLITNGTLLTNALISLMRVLQGYILPAMPM